MGILKEKKRAPSYKPVIANWIDTERDSCTVVGVMMDSKNLIGRRFTEIAERLNIRVTQNNFMSNIIVMSKNNLSEFIREIGLKAWCLFNDYCLISWPRFVRFIFKLFRNRIIFITYMSKAVLQPFEQYQKARVTFVQTVAELATRPQNI